MNKKNARKKEKLEHALYRKFETYIPRNETVRHLFQFPHSCILERFIYSHDWSHLKSLFSFIVRENFRLNHRRSGMYQ